MSLSDQNRATLERNVASAEARKALRVYETCLDGLLDAARAEGDPAAEGDIPSIIERGQTGERLSPTEQSAWTGYELGWKDGLKHAISDLGECFECGHDLNGPYCPACNSDIDAARAEGVAALQQAGEPVRKHAVCITFSPQDPEVGNAVISPEPDDDADSPYWTLIGQGGEGTQNQIAAEICRRWNALSPLPQQTALVEEGVEKIIGPHEPAACGASAPSEPPRSDGWQNISSAPRDGTTIQARIPGHGSDNMIAWISDALDDGNGSCGAWTFVLEDQEPPSCWSDGWCWAVNEDGERSAEPTEWKAAPSPADGGEG